VRTVRETAEILLMTSKVSGVDVNADKRSTRSCIEIRMQDVFTV